MTATLNTVIKTGLTLLWSLIILIAGSYYLFPSGYAFAAYHSGLLPITPKIKAAAPDLWYNQQEALLTQANEQLKQNRSRLSENRDRINSEITHYQHKAKQAHELLLQANELYQQRPDAETYYFIGKDYAPGSFSAQVVVLKGQKDAADQAVAALEQARLKLDETWIKVAKKSSQLSADQTRLSTARILWNSKRVLSELDIELDVEEVKAISEHDIRTVEELIDDASRIQTPKTRLVSSDELKLSSEALAILNGL